MASKTDTLNTAVLDELAAVLDSKFLKALSEPVRIEILKFILRNGRADIGTIARHMPQDRSVISRHLNLMQAAGILTCEKESRHIFYEIDGKAFLGKLENITQLIRQCLPLCCGSSDS